MRECWINVSVVTDASGERAASLGFAWTSREAASRFDCHYRLHARLKPEPYVRLTAAQTIVRLMGHR